MKKNFDFIDADFGIFPIEEFREMRVKDPQQYIKGKNNIITERQRSLDPVYYATGNHLNGPPKFVRCQIGLKFDEIKRALLIETIKECHGNKRMLARVLGLSEKTVYNKILKYGLEDLLRQEADKNKSNQKE